VYVLIIGLVIVRVTAPVIDLPSFDLSVYQYVLIIGLVIVRVTAPVINLPSFDLSVSQELCKL